MLQSRQARACSCHDNGICLNNRYFSWVLAGVILLGFCCFIAGYFFGKRKAAQELCTTLAQESLADKIYTSLCTIHEEKLVVSRLENDEDKFIEISEFEQNQEQAKEVDLLPVQSCDEGSHAEHEPSDEQYSAQLIGFGSQNAAHAFAKRLQEKNIPVYVKDRQGRTAKGKKTAWYQVVTMPFSDKQELEKIVDEVKLKERLKDVRIVTC